MARFLSSSDESDFEQKTQLQVKKRSRSLLPIDSEDEDLVIDTLGDEVIIINEKSQSPVKVKTEYKPKNGTQYMKNAIAVGSPSKKRSGKRKNQLSILAFSQQKLRKISTGSNSQNDEASDKTECPICCKLIPTSTIEVHADSCADSTSQSDLLTLSERQDSFSNLLDSDIFDDDCDIDSLTKKKVAQHVPVSKVKSHKQINKSISDPWNLDNTFKTDTSLLSERPSKRKKTATPYTNKQDIELAPYPEIIEIKTTRGFLRNSGNNPGKTVQMLLKNAPKVPCTESSEKLNRYSQAPNLSGGFKVHPFLAKASSSGGSVAKDRGSVTENVLIPDGEGGFMINDDALDSNNYDDVNNSDDSDDDGDEPSTSSAFSFPSGLGGGFIDFHNQFKEKSTRSPSTSRKSKSPKKKTYRRGGSRGRRGRGKRRGRGRGYSGNSGYSGYSRKIKKEK